MLVLEGGHQEIHHIGLYDDGGVNGGVGILITNETSVTQDYSIHDVSMKGLRLGAFVHYSWGGNWVNNSIVNCGMGLDLSNNINAMNFVHNYFANTNDVWLHGDSNYGNTFNGANEFEAYPGNLTASNAFMMSGINIATHFTENYVELKTNGVVVNGSYGTTIDRNVFILHQDYGTNIIIVGAEGPTVVGNRAVDQHPFIHVDSTTYGLNYDKNSVRGGASVTLSPINSYVNDTTNVVLKSSGGWWGLVQSGSMTNASGSRVIYLSDLVNGTNDLSGVLKTYTQNATNDLLTTVKTFTNETTLRAYTTNLDTTILTPATATNTMPLYGGFWRLVISTPAAITNLTGVTAGEYRYSTLVLSNSLGTDLTNYLLINAIPMGYAATNSVAVLGKNAYVIPNKKQVRLLIDCEGINQTNWAIISQ